MATHSASATAHITENTHLLHHQHSSALRLEEDVPFYSPPRQRQRWDDLQELPHTNWVDLFWDLFYVSGAFNLAAALKDSLNGWGVLYFCACYLSIYSLWYEKLAFDARFIWADNLTHRFIEFLQIMILGTVIANIKSVPIMSDTRNEPTTFLFCLGMSLQQVTFYVQSYDIHENIHHDLPESKQQARHDMMVRAAPCFLFLVATTWAASDYCNLSGPIGVYSFPSETDQSQESYENHGPIILVFAAFFASFLSTFVYRFVYIVKLGADHKEHSVPMNLDYVLHRLGEWTMLMLGESVLALLIVEQSPGLRYYLTFYSGIGTVALFQYLYYRMQPFEPDDHAMRRSSLGGYLFGIAQLFYSASLILIGCSFKMILHLYLDEAEEEGHTDEILVEQEQQSIANLFSWSMALSFISLDFTVVSHRGFVANFGRMRRNGKFEFMPILICCVDFTLIALMGSLSTWFGHHLENLVLVGMLLVAAQTLLRTRGLRYFPVSKSAFEEQGQDY